MFAAAALRSNSWSFLVVRHYHSRHPRCCCHRFRHRPEWWPCQGCKFRTKPRSKCMHIHSLHEVVPCPSCLLSVHSRPAPPPTVPATKIKASSAATKGSTLPAPMATSSSAITTLAKLATTASRILVDTDAASSCADHQLHDMSRADTSNAEGGDRRTPHIVEVVHVKSLKVVLWN